MPERTDLATPIHLTPAPLSIREEMEGYRRVYEPQRPLLTHEMLAVGACIVSAAYVVHKLVDMLPPRRQDS